MPPAPKVQRWTDLLAALLRRRFPATFEELAREVPAYSDPDRSAEALERMFERDKDELRAFGIPIRSEVSSDGDSHGYKLAATDFYLPYLALLDASGGKSRPRNHGNEGYRALKSLTFEPDELAAVADAAARVVQLGDSSLADDARSAMRKLAFDLPADAVKGDDGMRVTPADRALDAKTFDALGDALLRRKTATFDYYAIGNDSHARRTVDPWGLFFLGGHWYLVGRDHDRDDLRTFRVSRIRNAAANEKRANSADYEIPRDFDLKEHARNRGTWELGDAPSTEVIVEFRTLTGAVAAAAQLGEPVQGAADRRRFLVRRRDAFLRWLLAFGGDAMPVSPSELVEEFRRVAAATLAVYQAAPPAVGSRRA